MAVELISGTLADGSSPGATPARVRIAWPRGEDGTINIKVSKADGTAANLTGAIVLAIRKRGATNLSALVSRQGVITAPASGEASFAVGSSDTLSLTEGAAYRWDVQYTDTDGKRWQVVAESDWRVLPIVAYPTDVPTSPTESPLTLHQFARSVTSDPTEVPPAGFALVFYRQDTFQICVKLSDSTIKRSAPLT